MRIHRLEFGLWRDLNGKVTYCGFDAFESNCYCKFLDLGFFSIIWLSHECMEGIYKDKARRYRIKRYLKERAKRATSSPSQSNIP
jgi:hypothetical protein